MSARYSRIPTEDSMESGYGGLVFDYSSVFTFENDPSRNFKSVFTYTSDQNFHSQQHQKNGFEITNRSCVDRACYHFLNVIIYILFVMTFPISVWFAIKMVPNFERFVVFRWGRLYKTKGPGMVFVMPCIDRFHKVDIRMKAFTVPPQQVITADKAIVEVGADVFYRIASPELSITNVQNLDKSTRVLLQTNLLNLLVQLPFAKIEGHRNGIAQEVQENCNKMSNSWGTEICRLDISQIKVLQKPPVSQPKPSVALPPGLSGLSDFGAALNQSFSGDSVPEALQQLASAFFAKQGLSNSMGMQSPSDSDNLKSSSANQNSASSSYALPVPLSSPATEPAGSREAALARSTPVMMSVHDILKAAPSVLSESLVRKVKAVYQFQLHGEGGNVYFLNLKFGAGSIGEGVWLEEEEIDASLMTSVKDLQLMLCGHLKPFQAYMSGRLRVVGDLAAAMRLETFFDQLVSVSTGN